MAIHLIHYCRTLSEQSKDKDSAGYFSNPIPFTSVLFKYNRRIRPKAVT